jgi:hypothetical protein
MRTEKGEHFVSYTIAMQDWVTIKGFAAGTVALQPESDYLDISAFQDIASYVEVSDFVSATGTNIILQTSPVKEDAYFQNLVTITPAGAALSVNVHRASGAGTAPARWLRWRCAGTGAGWGVTFRIHLNGNPANSGR